MSKTKFIIIEVFYVEQEEDYDEDTEEYTKLPLKESDFEEAIEGDYYSKHLYMDGVLKYSQSDSYHDGIKIEGYLEALKTFHPNHILEQYSAATTDPDEFPSTEILTKYYQWENHKCKEVKCPIKNKGRNKMDVY